MKNKTSKPVFKSPATPTGKENRSPPLRTIRGQGHKVNKRKRRSLRVKIATPTNDSGFHDDSTFYCKSGSNNNSGNRNSPGFDSRSGLNQSFGPGDLSPIPNRNVLEYPKPGLYLKFSLEPEDLSKSGENLSKRNGSESPDLGFDPKSGQNVSFGPGDVSPIPKRNDDPNFGGLSPIANRIEPDLSEDSEGFDPEISGLFGDIEARLREYQNQDSESFQMFSSYLEDDRENLDPEKYFDSLLEESSPRKGTIMSSSTPADKTQTRKKGKSPRKSPAKPSKRQEKELDKWASLQSSHFNEVEDFELSFI